MRAAGLILAAVIAGFILAAWLSRALTPPLPAREPTQVEREAEEAAKRAWRE